jgi:hypothetical protein
MTAIRPRAHLDSGEGATDHALLDREVCARDNGSPLHRRGSTVLMAVSDPRFTEFANRIAAQCVRLGVRHTIDPQSPPETLRSKLPMLWPNSQRLPASRQHPGISSGRSNSMQVVDFDTFAAICGLTPHRAGLGLPERFPRAGPLPFE